MQLIVPVQPVGGTVTGRSVPRLLGAGTQLILSFELLAAYSMMGR